MIFFVCIIEVTIFALYLEKNVSAWHKI